MTRSANDQLGAEPRRRGAARAVLGGVVMLERRASDALWRELRQALVAAVREHNLRASTPIVVHEGEPLTLRLQRGEHVCDLRASRELVTCQVFAAPAKEVLFEWVIGLRPGTAPSFRMDGQAVHADAVAARLLGALLAQPG